MNNPNREDDMNTATEAPENDTEDTTEEQEDTTVVLAFSDVLALRECVSKDEARPILNCVHIANGYAEASNGHILARIPVDTGVKPYALDVLVKGDVFRMVKAGQSLSITRESVTVLAKGPRWGGLCSPVAVVPEPFEEGTFPDLKAVLAGHPEPTHRFSVNGKYLAKLAKMADKDTGRVTFALTFLEDAGLPWCSTGIKVLFSPDVTTEVVLMPLRVLDE